MRFYDKVVNVDENGHKEEEYVIVESEAEIVRMIYREYLSGKTIRQIADQLNELGIRTKRGNEWKPSSIEGMLTNYKYTGNAILGMTYKPDVLSKSRLKNEGQSPCSYSLKIRITIWACCGVITKEPSLPILYP